MKGFHGWNHVYSLDMERYQVEMERLLKLFKIGSKKSYDTCERIEGSWTWKEGMVGKWFKLMLITWVNGYGGVYGPNS